VKSSEVQIVINRVYSVFPLICFASACSHYSYPYVAPKVAKNCILQQAPFQIVGKF